MSVTNIVMLVKNRTLLTNQAVISLYDHTDEKLFNLTIVDDETSEENSALYRSLYKKDNATTLRIVKSKGITGQARNLGIYWAERYWGRGDYLYLTDNDVFFTKGWLTDLSHILSYGSDLIKVLGGWNHPFLQPSSLMSEHWMTYDPMDKHKLDVYSHDAVTGASQLMRWVTWDRYGPLDAHAVGVGQSEDWAFCQKIIKYGGRVGSIYPRVVLNCGLTNSHGKPSPGADLMLKELEEAKKQYPDLYYE